MRAWIAVLIGVALGCGGDDDPSGDTDADPDSGSSFGVLDEDGGEEEAQCSPFAQDCPEGEKCVPVAIGLNYEGACFAVVSQPAAIGEECTQQGGSFSGPDDCELGSMCLLTEAGSSTGICIELCAGSNAAPTCSNAEDTCAFEGGLPACLPKCDPLVGGCPEGWMCTLNHSVMQCLPDASGSDGAYGDICGYLNDCDPGLLCAPAPAVPGCGGLGCCTEFCELDPTTNPCSGAAQGQVCIELTSLSEPGLEATGFCGLP